MDLSAFSNDNFDPIEWINVTFQVSEAQTNKEATAAHLVLKLQSFIQEVNNDLERTAEQVTQNIPRIVREIEVMKQEAFLLKEQMQNVKDQVMKVERDSSQSMQSLLVIDTVKCRMQEACKALREADNWVTLSADVEEVFESGDINAISAKLVGMQNSLEMLVDVPDYKDRYQKLENLKNRLEAMLSPQLVAAFNTQSLEVAQVYVKIFRDIKRMQQLKKYYHKCQKSQLLQQWQHILEADPEESLIDWLNNFYDILLSTWHSQMSWCCQVFVDMSVIEILSELIVDVLSNLEPSLPFCIEAALKQQETPLSFLIEIKQITDRLSKSLEVAIQNSGIDHLQSVHVVCLAQTLYGPFRLQIENYTSLEKRALMSQLNSIHLKSEDVMDVVRLLGESVSKVFNIVQESERRCTQLTHGYGYPSLLQAIKAFFYSYADKLKGVLKLLRQMNRQKDQEVCDDWMLFQQALHTMQIAGEILLQLDGLEKLFTRRIQEISRKAQASIMQESENKNVTNPFHAYDDILLSSQMKKELKHLITESNNGNTQSLLEASGAFQHICAEIGRVISDIVYDQIQIHLQNLPSMKIWETENPENVLTIDLPTFSISPQEYITRIGQYLMTLPQHIEPFVLQDNLNLHTALKFAQFSYSSSQCEVPEQVADYLMGCLAQGIMEKYIETVVRIPNLTNYAAKQLITDIGYLSDILDDLGLSSSPALQNLKNLLEASAKEFSSVSQDKPTYLVAAIKNMRKDLK